MPLTRRSALSAFVAPLAGASSSQPEPGVPQAAPDRDPNNDDVRLPNGKSQKDAISKQAHLDALKDADLLLRLAQDLRDELKHSGDYVVAISSLRKTEEIEKLARRIRGRLKA
jgi:hypothetical protein